MSRRGPEWDLVEELKPGKNTSRLRCKSCGHEFQGGATRIKEHILGVGINVNHCSSPPPNAHLTLYKYVAKLKVKGIVIHKKSMLSNLHVSVSNANLGHNMACEAPHVSTRGCEGATSSKHASFSELNLEKGQDGVENLIESPYCSSRTTSVNKQSDRKSSALHAAFDKQSMLELHLKWTQAFIACGISFNVIRNPVFQDALLSTAKPGFVLPDYNKMRTEYLEKVKSGVETSIQRTVLDFVPSFGCTIAMDGWTSCQKKPLINVMCICPRGSVFLEAIDTSLKEKTISYISKVYERAIARVGGPKNVTAIVTDNASNYKGAGFQIAEKYPEITWVPCGAHSLNLLLKDIGKMKEIQPTLLEANHVVKFIREHQFTYALFRLHSDKVLRIFCATRFATAYYVLERMLTVRASLKETVADRRWSAWVLHNKQHVLGATKCVGSIGSENFWQRVEKIVSIAKPFVDLLRIVDTDKFVLGKVYWLMSEAIRLTNANEKCKPHERKEIANRASERWAQMHTPLHGAAFMVDPAFQMHDQSANKEVAANFKSVCGQLLAGDDGKAAFHQRVQFANRVDAYGDLWCLDAVKHLSAPVWWREYGSQTFELQQVATRVLSVAASSGSCERNWSAYDFIHTKRRNRLKASRARDLVYCFCNMRLLHRPQSIAVRMAQQHHNCPPKLTHDVITEDKGSEDEDEWDVDSTISDIEEIDDIVPVLIET